MYTVSSIEYLLFSERVKKLEASILKLSSQFEDLKGNLDQLFNILKEGAKIKNIIQ